MSVDPDSSTALPLRILVIDDSPEIVTLLSRKLTRWGHEIFTASCGATGLMAALNVRPDVVLTDLEMPGINGLELARRLRNAPELAHIVLVAVSGSLPETPLQLFDHKFAKPVDFTSLQALLARVSARQCGDPPPEA